MADKDDCLRCGLAEGCSARGTPCAMALNRVEIASAVLARKGSGFGEEEPDTRILENRGMMLREQYTQEQEIEPLLA